MSMILCERTAVSCPQYFEPEDCRLEFTGVPHSRMHIHDEQCDRNSTFEDYFSTIRRNSPLLCQLVIEGELSELQKVIQTKPMSVYERDGDNATALHYAGRYGPI